MQVHSLHTVHIPDEELSVCKSAFGLYFSGGLKRGCLQHKIYNYANILCKHTLIQFTIFHLELIKNKTTLLVLQYKHD